MGEALMKEIIVLSGVSGVGKTYLLQNTLQTYQWLCQIPSVTTRIHREGVNESASRIFLNRADFITEENKGNLIFVNTVFGEKYAYRKADIVNGINSNKTVLIEMKISSVKQVRAMFSKVACVYITANKNYAETEIETNRNNRHIRLQDAIDESNLIKHTNLYAGEIDVFFYNNFDEESLYRFKNLIMKLR